MASPGELVKLIAAVTGEEEATVTVHDRNLVLAGLRTKGGRGRSAAKVTPRDAAHLLTSVLGAHRVKDSVATVQRYMQTQEHQAHWHQHHPDKLQNMGKANVWEDGGIPELAALPLDHTFIDALTVLITLAAEGRLIKELGDFYPFDNLRIIVTSPRTHARITLHAIRTGKTDSKSVGANYGSNETPPAWMKDNSVPRPRQKNTVKPKLDRWTETNAMPLIYIGALLAGKLGELPRLETEAHQ